MTQLSDLQAAGNVTVAAILSQGVTPLLATTFLNPGDPETIAASLKQVAANLATAVAAS